AMAVPVEAGGIGDQADLFALQQIEVAAGEDNEAGEHFAVAVERAMGACAGVVVAGDALQPALDTAPFAGVVEAEDGGGGVATSLRIARIDFNGGRCLGWM